MPGPSLEERVSVLERYFVRKSLEEHFRAQAEMLDERFAAVDARFAQNEERLARMEARLDTIMRELATVRNGLEVLLSRG